MVGSIASFSGNRSGSVGRLLMYLITTGRPDVATIVGPSRTGVFPGCPYVQTVAGPRPRVELVLAGRHVDLVVVGPERDHRFERLRRHGRNRQRIDPLGHWRAGCGHRGQSQHQHETQRYCQKPAAQRVPTAGVLLIIQDPTSSQDTFPCRPRLRLDVVLGALRSRSARLLSLTPAN